MTECPEHSSQSDWRTPEERSRDTAQVVALRPQASIGGLRFDVFLPPSLAEWVLDLVAEGVFVDPGEAVFVLLGEQRDLEPHKDLRKEILRRSLEASMNGPHPGFSAEEVNERMREMRAAPRPEPATWRKDAYM